MSERKLIDPRVETVESGRPPRNPWLSMTRATLARPDSGDQVVEEQEMKGEQQIDTGSPVPDLRSNVQRALANPGTPLGPVYYRQSPYGDDVLTAPNGATAVWDPYNKVYR